MAAQQHVVPAAASLTSQPSEAFSLQLAKPARQVRGEQVPPEQVAGSALAPVLQVVPQPPQLVALVFRSTCTSADSGAVGLLCRQKCNGDVAACSNNGKCMLPC
jgi:hypothetical protein